MKRTNYGHVAQQYDQNKGRRRIRKEGVLSQLLEQQTFSSESPLRVLDLGCGTGNYLQVQMEAFASETAQGLIEWYGIDASEAMLEKARKKVAPAAGGANGAVIRQGDAHALPYKDGYFHFVSCNFAFHHFEDKGEVLDEVCRVLAAGGVFKNWNIQPEKMSGWWVYRFFPQAFLEDSERFWAESRLWLELEKRGFQVYIKASRTLRQLPVSEIMQDITRRDISELSNLDDSVYSQGAAVAAALHNRSSSATLPDEFAQMSCIATKSEH